MNCSIFNFFAQLHKFSSDNDTLQCESANSAVNQSDNINSSIPLMLSTFYEWLAPLFFLKFS